MEKDLIAKHLQFITHKNERFDHLQGAKAALEGGCKWIQLRMKGIGNKHFLEVGKQLRELCYQYHAILILDDRVECVEILQADGVHLGKKDMPIEKARKILGPEKIIGGTANTMEDIRNLARNGVDYIGCGPFRFTRTKEHLAPTLGLEGYRALMAQMRDEKIHIPLVSIGGIELKDVRNLMAIGAIGIAVSSAILDTDNPTVTTRKFIAELNS